MATMIRAASTIFSLRAVSVSAPRAGNASISQASDSPGLSNIDHVYAIGASLPEIRVHVDLEILGSNVTLRCKQLLDIVGGRVEDRRQLTCGRHLDRVRDLFKFEKAKLSQCALLSEGWLSVADLRGAAS
jgi:hypothetical protein